MFPRRKTLTKSVLHLYQNYPTHAKVAVKTSPLELKRGFAWRPAGQPSFLFQSATAARQPASEPQSQLTNTFQSGSRPPGQTRNPSEPALHIRTATAQSK